MFARAVKLLGVGMGLVVVLVLGAFGFALTHREAVPDPGLSLLVRLPLASAVFGTAKSGEEPSAVRGEYLAGVIGGCRECHTPPSPDGGEMTAIFTGGREFSHQGDSGRVFVSPALTPSRDGVLDGWSEEQFVARFRSGEMPPGSPMPWGQYRRLTDTDIRSIYQYLQTLPTAGDEPGS